MTGWTESPFPLSNGQNVWIRYPDEVPEADIPRLMRFVVALLSWDGVGSAERARLDAECASRAPSPPPAAPWPNPSCPGERSGRETS